MKENKKEKIADGDYLSLGLYAFAGLVKYADYSALDSDLHYMRSVYLIVNRDLKKAYIAMFFMFVL